MILVASLQPCAGIAHTDAGELMPDEAITSPAASSPSDSMDEATKPAEATAAPSLPEEENLQISNTVVLQGLNKVTGHISKLEGPIGVTQRFGNLEIIPRRCWKSSPEDSPENAVLLEIRELKIGEESKKIFLGWMFSSSPGLSGLEHPVYDVSVVSCEFRTDPENGVNEATPPADDTDAKPVKKPAKKKKKAASQ